MVSLLATREESVVVASVELVEDDEVSLEASEPEALPDVEALPLKEPEAELGELGELVSLDVLELLVAGSLLATREESVLVEDVSLDVEELGVVLLLAESALATLESVDVRPVGERSSLVEAEVAPELIVVSLLVIDALCELELAGSDDVVPMLSDAAVVPRKPNEPEALVFAADVSVLELFALSFVLLAVELLTVFELLTVAFWLW